jgi:hypothetical protein
MIQGELLVQIGYCVAATSFRRLRKALKSNNLTIVLGNGHSNILKAWTFQELQY